MRPVILLVLDGWGVTDKTRGNAIFCARTPNYHFMQSRFPQSLLQASGVHVGLPPGLMGNSEVGHLNIGAGRVVMQKLTQISQTILDGTFFKNPVLVEACRHCLRTGGALHIFGLLGDGCVHSSPDHLAGLIELAKKEKVKKLILHPLLDGRDTPPRSALKFMQELQDNLNGTADIGVVCGRYYAMDRDNRWERTERFWRALVHGQGGSAGSAVDAVNAAYSRGENDEFVAPTLVGKKLLGDGDSVICFNFRPDRVRQISRALTQFDFTGFSRDAFPKIYFACLTEYDAALNLPVAFAPAQLPSQDMSMTLPEYLACHHIDQFHTAETEKYAHITYFLNGGKEAPLEGEERELVPSLKVATYDLAPAMQTARVCEIACQAIVSGKYPFIVLNFANPDMVGHTGVMEAAIEAVQSVDVAFAHLLDATSQVKGCLVVTADHGNIEQMIDYQTGQPHTAHTTNPVPLILANFNDVSNHAMVLKDGVLADVAPTILQLMGLPKPAAMTGCSLIGA